MNLAIDLAGGQAFNDSAQGGSQAQAQAITIADALDAIKRWTGEYSQVGSWRCLANASSYTVTGGAGATNLGSPSNVGISTGTYCQRKKRLRFPTTGTPNTICGSYSSNAEMIGTDGFSLLVRFCCESMSATCVWFAGAQPGVPTAVVPSSLTDVLGIGAVGGTDTNVQVYTNDASGSATKIDLGSNFPAFATGATYEAEFVVVPGAATVYYRVRRLDVPQIAVGSFAADIATNTQLLRRAIWNYNTAAANVFGAGMELDVSVPL